MKRQWDPMRHPTCSQGDEHQAIDLAQASIDGYRTSELRKPPPQASPTRPNWEKLSAVLDLMGSLGAVSSAREGPHDDGPMRIGRYDVIGDDGGRGGFGIVLRAFDTILQREVGLNTQAGTTAGGAGP